jgi:hypothetical protein
LFLFIFPFLFVLFLFCLFFCSNLKKIKTKNYSNLKKIKSGNRSIRKCSNLKTVQI